MEELELQLVSNTESRDRRRFEYERTAVLVTKLGLWNALTIDASLKGLRVRSSAPLAEGQCVEVEVQSGDLTVRRSLARVAWSKLGAQGRCDAGLSLIGQS